MYETIVVNEKPLPVTNASCCSAGTVMCGACRAAALAMPAYVPDKMPTPAGLVDNAIDEDDVLLLPHDAAKQAATQIASDSEWCYQNAAPESDDDILPSEPPPLPTKTVCEQCSGTGTKLEQNTPNANFGLPDRTVECALCEGKGFTLEGATTAPNLARVSADRHTSNVAQPVYAGAAGAPYQADPNFDEDDVLLPNQF